MHYLCPDYTGKLKSKVLECNKFDKRHTSINLKEDFDRIGREYEIQDKTVHVNVDNAKNIQGAVQDLDCESDGCSAHTTNLSVKDTLKDSPEVKAIEAKMNGTIKFTRTSNEGKKFLMECQGHAGFECKTLKLYFRLQKHLI